MKNAILAFTCAVTVAISTSYSLAAGPQNATCVANFPGYGSGTLTIKNGKPVAYRTSTYIASSVSRSGNTIRIDAARFTITSESANALIGNWRLGSYHPNGVKFSCR